MITEEQLVKLPRYARREIELLRYALENALKLLTTQNVVDTNVTMGHSQEVVGLPKDARLTFKLGHDFSDWVNVFITAGPRGYVLDVMGNADITLEPHAANLIKVSPGGR